jgi:hypothetical protein
MSFPLARKKSSSSSLRRKASESSTGIPSDQNLREEISSPYTNPRRKTLLESKGSFVDKSDVDVTSESTANFQTLLDSEQNPAVNTLFRDDLLDKACRRMEDRNEAMVIQDISRLIVPSAQNMAIFGAEHLEKIIENVTQRLERVDSDAWSSSSAGLFRRIQAISVHRGPT